MSLSAVAHAQDSTVASTIRFPAGLREKVAADAERCGRSFDGQVVALLRRHYGEECRDRPETAEILALAVASFADVPPAELGSLIRRLREPES
jgi:molybdopterin converting factor small subunit